MQAWIYTEIRLIQQTYRNAGWESDQSHILRVHLCNPRFRQYPKKAVGKQHNRCSPTASSLQRIWAKSNYEK